MKLFKAGDRVRYVGDYAGFSGEEVGTVVDGNRETYDVGYRPAAVVKWDNPPAWTLIYDSSRVRQDHLAACAVPD